MSIMSKEQFIDLVCSKVDFDYLASIYIDHVQVSRNKRQGMPIDEKKQLIRSLEKSYDRFFCFQKKFATNNKTILEIGSGFGGFVLAGNLHGIRVTGIEPDKKMAWITMQMLSAFDFHAGLVQTSQGEDLPLESNLFDYVVSFQVLEHVEDPKKVLREAIRVLKPEGYIHFIFPNYNSFYEGHIEKAWFPFINKKNVKTYLRLMGVDEGKLDYVNFLTPKLIREYLKDYKDKIRIVSLGEKEFIEQYFSEDEENARKIKNKYLALAFKLICTLKLNKLLARLLICFDWYYPIVLTIKLKSKS